MEAKKTGFLKRLYAGTSPPDSKAETEIKLVLIYHYHSPEKEAKLAEEEAC